MIATRKLMPSFDLSSIPIGAYAAAGSVVLVFVMGMVLSQPSRAKARITELERQAVLIDAVSASSGDLDAFPVGTVCTGLSVEILKSQLTKSLLQSGLQVEGFDLTEGQKVGRKSKLQTYTMSMKAKGSYEQAITAMERLAQYRPQLFLDTLSLRNQTDSVDLAIEGHLFCRSKT